MHEDNRLPKPAVSVIIPFYRGADWLCEAVDSVLTQTCKDSEIIVVNDGSPEDISGFEKRYADRVTYIEKENGGAASARNEGIRRASGEYIAFLDSDDLWNPDKLSVQLDRMRAYDAVWSYTDYETFGIGAEPQLKRMREDAKEGLYPRFSPYIGTPTVMISRAFLTENRLSFCEDMQYGEDSVLWEQLIAAAPALYVPQVLSRVRLRGANAGVRAAVQIRARVDIYDRCAATIPGYKQSCSLTYRCAVALCRFGSLFVSKKRIDRKGTELIAKLMFALPYLLFKADRKRYS